MSRQAHLPPRCPRPFHDPISPLQRTESYPGHNKSSFQNSILEDQPTWLDDLLSDSSTNSVGIIHRRSSSDSVTLLDGLADSFSGLNPCKDDDNSVGNKTCSGLESACVYGPNSPRKRGNITFSENAIVSALSECVVENPLQYVDESLCISGINHSDLKGDACTSTGELNAEAKMAKRHSGQRSRVRKLQYIAELERTTLQSELSVRVASLLQQHVSLSLENRTLKQQVARVQQEKLIMEGQYKSLKKEAERLKIVLAKSSPTSKAKAYFGSSRSAAEASRSEVSWQMLDMANLNLN
ncbi:hypothetical protein Pint_05776 [Pistacia integerrima]|uniref:Uncharacterized protein n=1 Tax=Pistacia integerrima TaxID=434235 RepID=A0ACC0Z7P8_9ROSI|nr:hypothetical protein Pint_05776 [Pistacia integerrima]